MNLLNEYKSVVEASNKTGVSKNSITSCCTKNQVQSKGFTFRFEENRNEERINKVKKTCVSIR